MDDDSIDMGDDSIDMGADSIDMEYLVTLNMKARCTSRPASLNMHRPSRCTETMHPPTSGGRVHRMAETLRRACITIA